MSATGGPDRRGRASIVIPVYDQAFYTRVCLASLEPAQGGAEIIVVDNGSTDGTGALLAAWRDPDRRRHVLTFPENRGFGPACNAGAERAAGDVVVFLNNDTFVLECWLPALLAAFDDEAVAVAGSRLLYPNGHVQHAGLAFRESGAVHVFVGLPGDAPVVLEARDCQAVTGASLAIRAETFRRLGGFDTGYQNAFEDVDLCLRVVEEGGRIRYVPDSVAHHFESMSAGRTGPSEARGYQRFMERWRGRFTCDADELEDRARRAGHDIDRRVSSRPEIMDLEANLEARATELADLRRTVSLRSVRAVLRARRLYHRLARRG